MSAPVFTLPANRVLDEVASLYGLTRGQLVGKSRRHRLVEPRQIAMYLLRKHCRMSLQEVGEAFGRHHTTALYGIRVVNERLCDVNLDERYLATVETLEARIGSILRAMDQSLTVGDGDGELRDRPELRTRRAAQRGR